MSYSTLITVVARATFISLMSALVARAQSKPPITQRFTVASVKPCKPDGRGSRGGGSWPPAVDPRRLSLSCLQLDFLIREAWLEYEGGRRGRSNIFAAQITGEPAWLQSDRFNIDAITDDPVCQATMLGPMLRALLEDRFKLKIRKETREAPIYELTVAKNGPKLKRFDDSCTNPEDFTKTPQYPTLPKSPTDYPEQQRRRSLSLHCRLAGD